MKVEERQLISEWFDRDEGDPARYELIGRAIMAGAWLESIVRLLAHALTEDEAVRAGLAGDKLWRVRKQARNLLDQHVDNSTNGTIANGRITVSDVKTIKGDLSRSERLMDQRNNLAHGVLVDMPDGDRCIAKAVAKTLKFELTPADEDYLTKLIDDLNALAGQLWDWTTKIEGRERHVITLDELRAKARAKPGKSGP